MGNPHTPVRSAMDQRAPNACTMCPQCWKLPATTECPSTAGPGKLKAREEVDLVTPGAQLCMYILCFGPGTWYPTQSKEYMDATMTTIFPAIMLLPAIGL